MTVATILAAGLILTCLPLALRANQDVRVRVRADD